MKEQEYINVQELTRITSALEILSDIVPDNSKIIDSESFAEITKELWRYRTELCELIKITDS